MISRLSVRSRLWIILALTLILWIGVFGIHLNADDYQYIESMAPIRSWMDILKPFWSHDANPSFFRPLANATMAFDFLLFGWTGSGYHATNLLFHLCSTLLVFYFVRDVFEFSERDALWVMLIFGLAASHDYNLVVDTARADVLVALFVMSTLILAKRGYALSSTRYTVAAWIAFALTLCAKEIAIVSVVLVPALVVENEGAWKQRAQRYAKCAVPYLAIVVLFYFYHAHFTFSAAESQPLQSEGMRSVAAMMRNAVYGVGYLVLPLDLDTATRLLTGYRELAIAVGVLLFAILTWLAARSARGQMRSNLWRPIVFLLLTGSIVLLSFERWRLYLPSVALAAVAVVIVKQILEDSNSNVRNTIAVVLLLLGGYHIERAISAQFEWRRNTALLQDLCIDLSHILAEIPQRPLTLLLITSPSKLGSATVMQLGQNAVAQYAEADRRAVPGLQYGWTGNSQVNCFTAIELYSLQASSGFAGLRVSKNGAGAFTVSAPDNSPVSLVPSGIEASGIARRDARLAVADTIMGEKTVAIIRKITDGLAKEVEVLVRDTNVVPIYFDGKGFKRFD